MMKRYLTAYLVAAVAVVAADMVWLTLVAYQFYRDQLGPLLADPFNLPAALGFYALYLVGVVVFAVAPALNSGRWVRAPLLGALLGLVAYGTYDLTNLATLRQWPLALTVVDMAWGMTLSAFAATVSTLVTRALFRR